MTSVFRRMGLDVGSTTAKLFVLDSEEKAIFSLYRRHSADIANTLAAMFAEAQATLGDEAVQLSVTGSAGMGIAERSGISCPERIRL